MMDIAQPRELIIMIKNATPEGGRCSKYPLTAAVAEKKRDTNYTSVMIERCRSVDEWLGFLSRSLMISPGFSGFSRRHDPPSCINQSSLPSGVCPEHPLVLRRYLHRPTA